MNQGVVIGGEVEMTRPSPPARRARQKKQQPAPEPPKTCMSCGKVLDWRDEQYGAAARGLCRTHKQWLDRYALNGNYQKLDDGKGGQRLNVAGQSNREKRRELERTVRQQRQVTPPMPHKHRNMAAEAMAAHRVGKIGGR